MREINLATLITMCSIPIPAAVAWTVLRYKVKGRTRISAGAVGLLALTAPAAAAGWWASKVVESGHLLAGLMTLFVPSLGSLALLLAVMHDVDRVERQTSWSRWEFALRGVVDFAMQFVPLGWLILLVSGAIALDLLVIGSWASLLLTSAGALLLSFTTYPFVLSVVIGAKPLPAGLLRNELLAISKRAGLGRINPYVFPGRKGRIVTAWTSGMLGPTRRIFLSDALIDTLSQDELAAIYAHELGHLKLGHLWLNLALTLLNLALLFGVVAAVVRVFPTALNPMMMGLLGGGMGMATSIPSFALMRRNELAADLYSARLTRKPEALIQALQRLESPLLPANRGEASVGSLWSTHPSLSTRIQALARVTVTWTPDA